VSAAASASAVCFDIIAALHEYFDQTAAPVDLHAGQRAVQYQMRSGKKVAQAASEISSVW
jgi:hypothetical protein